MCFSGLKRINLISLLDISRIGKGKVDVGADVAISRVPSVTIIVWVYLRGYSMVSIDVYGVERNR